MPRKCRRRRCTKSNHSSTGQPLISRLSGPLPLRVLFSATIVRDRRECRSLCRHPKPAQPDRAKLNPIATACLPAFADRTLPEHLCSPRCSSAHLQEMRRRRTGFIGEVTCKCVSICHSWQLTRECAPSICGVAHNGRLPTICSTRVKWCDLQASPHRAMPGLYVSAYCFLADGHGDAALCQLGVEHVRIDHAFGRKDALGADLA